MTIYSRPFTGTMRKFYSSGFTGRDAIYNVPHGCWYWMPSAPEGLCSWSPNDNRRPS
jgi:hypothetical protein